MCSVFGNFTMWTKLFNRELYCLPDVDKNVRMSHVFAAKRQAKDKEKVYL
jgi:hypothetical protein